MSGGTGSSAIEALNQRLDRWEAAQGFPPLEPPGDLSVLLAPTRESLRGMSAEECGEAALLLAQLGFHLQRLANRERTTAQMTRERLAREVVPRTASLSYKSPEEKWHLALSQDEGLRELEQVRCQALAQLGRIEFLASRVEQMAKLYDSLQQTKRKQHG